MKIKTTLLFALSAAVIAGPSFAEDTEFSIDEITCFDVISLPEEDSLFVTALLIGFKSGMANSAQTSTDQIKSAVEALDTACGDNPDMKAIEALS